MFLEPATAALYEDKYSLAFPSFGPERRGAPVLGFTKIDDKKIVDRSEVQACDYVVILDETLIDENTFKGLKENAIIIVNTNNSKRYDNLTNNKIISIDATSIALDILGKPITNTAMLGALVAVSNIVTLDSVVKGIESEMHASLVKKNVEVVKTAYEMTKGVI